MSQRRLYVYHRVGKARLDETVTAVRAMRARLGALRPGLAAVLLRRPDLRDREVTLMDAYAGSVTTGLVAGASTLPQSRHAETFQMLE